MTEKEQFLGALERGAPHHDESAHGLPGGQGGSEAAQASAVRERTWRGCS